ncbi:MAG: hypothetical protein D3910_01480 [Candidatus Electrothrix sp. ATG2]|nr:hypothetical protein [Candidatus Electrothrix sp. ATG2]
MIAIFTFQCKRAKQADMNEQILNCWEVKDCGREPHGKNVHQEGICPVSVDFRVNGIHNGKNGGRCCWVFSPKAGKYDDTVLSCLEKARKCSECDFYKLVKNTTSLLVYV